MFHHSRPRRLGRRSASASSLALVALACSKSEPPRPSAQPSSPPPAAVALPLPALPAAPQQLGPLRAPANNPTTPAKVLLGQRLFFDPALSVDGSRSCYSCHQNEDGTGGHEPTAIGAKNASLPRHAPVLWNVAYLPALNWDGRANSLESQARGAWSGRNMGVGEQGLAAKAEAIGAAPGYPALFAAAFPGVGATPTSIVQAIAAYERTLFCADTKFDRHFAGDASALSADERAGLEVFIGKASCHSCHTPPFFSDAYLAEDGSYHNLGVGLAGKGPGDRAPGDTASGETAPREIDPGRIKISQIAEDFAAFKTPSLRNVTRSAPYLHDGSIASLEDTVRFMASGGYKNPAIDPKMVDKKLTDADVDNLVAFLGALECSGKLEPAPAL
jgi:cytochrome c peroxidase